MEGHSGFVIIGDKTLKVKKWKVMDSCTNEPENCANRRLSTSGLLRERARQLHSQACEYEKLAYKLQHISDDGTLFDIICKGTK